MKKDKHIEYYPNGQKKKEGTYTDGKMDGLWIDWYENGQKYHERTFIDGYVEGLDIRYHKNGHYNRVITTKRGQTDGLDTFYYENGQKKTEEEMIPYTINDGYVKVWFEDGQKKLEGTYNNGERNGKWTYYNFDGSVREVKDYDKDDYDEKDHHLKGSDINY